MKKNERSKVYRECADTMMVPVLLNAANTILNGILGVVTANILGSFADKVFALDLTLGARDVVRLLICIAMVVFVAPAIGLIGDFIMLNKSLYHDNVVFGHFLDKEPEKEKRFDIGEVQYELEDAPNTLRIQWVTIMSKAAALPFCVGYLLYCAGKISWLLTGCMFLFSAIRLVVPIWFKEKMAAYDKLEKSYQAKRRNYEADIVSKPYMLKLLGIQKAANARIEELFQKYYQQTGSRYAACRAISDGLKEAVNRITMLLLLLVGAVMIAKRYVTPGEFTAMMVYLGVAQTILNDTGEMIQNYPLLKNAAERVEAFYQDMETVSGERISCFSGLTGENISFSYADKSIFQNFHFSVMPGDKVKISGENGRGKSTLIKIICSLISSYNGRIKTGNTDLKQSNMESWREMIAYVPQIPYLFQTTVKENIVMGNADVKEDEVERLMQEFGIRSLADRVITEQSELSGGEKQKISIIRALVKKSELLILDEPSNHLDQESIEVLKRYLCENKKTVILISHDSTMDDVVNQSISI